MQLEDILNNEIFDLPIKPSKYFPKSVSDLLFNYFKLILSVNDKYKGIIKENLPTIKFTINKIEEIVDFVFKGNTAQAYSLFTNLIETLEPYLTYPNKNVQLPTPKYLFKARKVFEKDFGLNDMFHVPFEKRYSIPTSRFSLPGVPCLYLSNSIFTCWEELERPIFQQMAVSRFEPKGKYLRFLNLENDALFLKKLVSKKGLTIPPQVKKEEIFAVMQAHKALGELPNHILPRFINTFPLLAVLIFRGC